MEDLTKKKTYVADVERTLYDIRDEDRSSYKTAKGLTEDIVRDISAKKEEPEWMLQNGSKRSGSTTRCPCRRGDRIFRPCTWTTS